MLTTSTIPNQGFSTTGRLPVKKISGLLMLAGAFLLATQFVPRQSAIPTEDNVGVISVQPNPTRVKISAISVDAPIIEMGLNADQTIEVPTNESDVGWFKYSPSPGGEGPSVLVGHLDSVRGRAVFYDLNKLKAGDEVEVVRGDGTVAVFRVESSEYYSQDNFPTEKVYGAIDYAGIRLITCSGKYNFLKGRYSDNLVVYGRLVRITNF